MDINKKSFAQLLSATHFSEQDYQLIDELADRYPWFNLAHALKAKALRQQDKDYSKQLKITAVYSSDRKRLYEWIIGDEEEKKEESGLFGHTEIEFLEEETVEEGEGYPERTAEDEAGDTDMEGQDEGEDSSGEDLKGPVVKEETEMEEPEVEEPESVPVMDAVEDKEEGDLEKISPEEAAGENSAGVATQAESGSGEKDPEDASHETVAGWNKEAPSPEQPEGDELPKPAAGKRTGKKNELIQRFIQEEPGVIQADKPTELEGDIAAGSVKEDDSYITDTLAKIYVKQGLLAKAIYAYEKLSLKYPEKSAYFAAQIEKIKNISNS